jgi:uncharacterized membrane protein YdbT with pleckstrin-like domain
MTSELLPGENLIVQAHPHWIVIVKYLWAPVVLLIVVAIADLTFLQPINQPESLLKIQHLRIYLALAAIAIAGIWFIVVGIRWQSTTYTLTDQRIKIETGVFGRQSKMIPIDRIQDCTTKQSLFGRIIGYGRVEVDAAGAQGAEVLDHMPNPGAFRDQVFVQSEKRRGGAPAAPANPSGV